jgi:hypothetical protein
VKEKGVGWLTFASILMVIGGVGNLVWGLAAIATDELFLDRVLFANLTFWGVAGMVLGAILVGGGFAVLGGAQWARTFGIAWAILSVMFYLMVIWAYPAWSALAIGMDILVIYGLVEYGSLAQPPQ